MKTGGGGDGGEGGVDGALRLRHHRYRQCQSSWHDDVCLLNSTMDRRRTDITSSIWREVIGNRNRLLNLAGRKNRQ